MSEQLKDRVVIILGAISLLCLGGIILLASTGKDIPNVLEILCASSLTGLLGVLVPTK